MAYCAKVFALAKIVRTLQDSRPYPVIPTQCVFLSLLLGAIIRADSYLSIAQQTKRRSWQRLIHWPDPISDDTLCYVSEQLKLEPLRQALVSVNKQLKHNKAFNELTQFYALGHCYHHHLRAVVAQMLILMLGFVLFNANHWHPAISPTASTG
ncbi:MAG: hypothetical protein QHJ82_15985 [Verrucomicrobiota bacterium]|nr:hypothetical protein [Verrucomicrobiota bacterium]